MSPRCWCHWVLAFVLMTGCGVPDSPSSTSGGASASGGKLFRWSGQVVTSDKAIIFVHGYRLDIPTTGPSQQLLESIFSFKVANFEFLGQESFGKPTSELVEYWFYGYYPQQSSETIAADLAAKIQNHPDLRGKQIAVIGYSQGGLVCWLLDQDYHLIKGGVLLGAPILGTPLANKSLRDAAVRRIISVSSISDKLINLLDRFAQEVAGLEQDHSETGQAQSKLVLYAGQIDPCSSAKLTVNFLDSMGDWVTQGDRMQTSNRRFAEAGALVISQCAWRGRTATDRQSDGIIPVSSATGVGIGTGSRIWVGYDHYDLLTGRLELDLDRATLEWIDQVLQLSPEFPEEENIPALPDIEISTPDLLTKAKFAYIQNSSLVLSDADWQEVGRIDSGEPYAYPRFSPDGKSLVFTLSSQDTKQVCQLEGSDITAVTTGWYADFSPNGEWLAYQDAEGLCIIRLADKQPQCVVRKTDLLCPPIWVTKGWVGRIYFISRSADEKTNLYVVSPRARDKELSSVDIVAHNCLSVFLARGAINGVVAVSGDSSRQKFAVISNLLQSDISLELQSGSEEMSFSWDKLDFKASIVDPLPIQSAVLDQTDDYALYLETESGIYLFSITSEWEIDGVNFDYDLSEVCPGAHQLDINPAASK